MESATQTGLELLLNRTRLPAGVPKSREMQRDSQGSLPKTAFQAYLYEKYREL
jgi:hypothetical protein